MNAKELHDLFASGRAYVACDGERLIDEATAREADAIAARALRLLAAAEANDGSTPETNVLSNEISRRTFAQEAIKAADVFDALDLSRRFEAERNALAARVRELEPDAERYATMRRAILNDFNGLKFLQYMHWPLDTFDAAGGFDAAIDAARSAP